MFNILRCNPNVKWIVIALVATFIVADCFDNVEKDIIGNILLLVGQVFIILAIDGEESIIGR